MAETLNNPNFWASKRRLDAVRKGLSLAVIVLLSVAMIIPLAWMIAVSLKDAPNVFKMPPFRVDWRWSNYLEAWYPQGQPAYFSDARKMVGVVQQIEGLRAKAPSPKAKKAEADAALAGLAREIQAAYKVNEDGAVRAAGLLAKGVHEEVLALGMGMSEERSRVIEIARILEGKGILEIDGEIVRYKADKAAESAFLAEEHGWDDFLKFFNEKESFWWYLWNTLIITCLSTMGTLVTSALVAYGFARIRFPGRDFLFVMVISTMMIPQQVTMIPTFILFSEINWVGTYLPLIVPAWLGGSAYNIFLFRQFFMTIPYELDEAAKIDGCSPFGTFWRILLPLSVPSLITVGIFAVVWNWNDFLNPLIYLKSSETFTLALGMQQFSSLYGNKTHLMMAASTVVLLPILILFFIGQKYFIQGIATTGLKG